MQPFVGEIRLFPWDWAPKYWALCNGALLSIAQNQALFSLLGIQYGGDGRVTFGLPDLRSRTSIGASSSYPQGTPTGTETVTLLPANMPIHSHAVRAVTDQASAKGPSGHLFGTDTSSAVDFLAPPNNLVALNPQSVSLTGSSLPHPNLQPYTTLNYCIATSGIFPSRN